MGTFAFSVIECLAHTVMGTIMFFKFRSKGKTTIYGPGSITAYWGFMPIGFIAFDDLQDISIGMKEWAWCIGILLFIIVCCILIPENLIKNKDTAYPFRSAGYYEKYIK